MKVEFEQIENGKNYIVKVICAECEEILNESIVMTGAKLRRNWSMITLTSGFNADDCPKGCRPTYSDFNINTKFEIYEVETVKV